MQHSERVKCWVQKMVVLADDTFFDPSAFNHCQMVLSFRKLSNDNQIDQNNISRNAIGCQIESSTGNKIFHNNFLNNKEQSQDVRGNNSWDDGNVSGGNYWSDHVAKGNPSNNWPRQIKGGIMQDRYPFQSESGWLAAKAAASSSVAKA